MTTLRASILEALRSDDRSALRRLENEHRDPHKRTLIRTADNLLVAARLGDAFLEHQCATALVDAMERGDL